MSARYRAEDAANLIQRSCGEVQAIYHRPSGQTHIVASPVPEILDAMGADCLEVGALHDRLAARFDLGTPNEAFAELVHHLEVMDALGLVYREVQRG